MKKHIPTFLIWLGNKLPYSCRNRLTYSAAANWFRRVSLLAFGHGLVLTDLSGPLFGFKMKLDLQAGHRRYALGTYEPDISSLLRSRLKPGMVAMDIGANIGFFTLLMANLVGTVGRVIAFEPFPPVYTLLEENIRINNLKWVIVECLAIADVEGSARMKTDPTNEYSFITQLSDVGDLNVTTTSVDIYFVSKKFTRLDFIKIDVEGVEDIVVKGMAHVLKNVRPAVLVEIHTNDGHESG